MSKIVTVFTAGDTCLSDMEKTAQSCDLAVGPFSKDNEKELVDFLTNKLFKLRAICRQGGHRLSLHFKANSNGWLLETINRYSHLGLTPFCIDGLILESTNYEGSLLQLWAETTSFSGKKVLMHTKRSEEYCKNLFEEMSQCKWGGLYIKVEGTDESDRYNQTIALLQIGKNSFKIEIPIWTELFSSERMNSGVQSAKSDGFHIKFDDLRFAK